MNLFDQKLTIFQSMLDRLVGKAMLAVDYLSDNLTRDQILPILSAIATLTFIVAIGYGMSYLVYVQT